MSSRASEALTFQVAEADGGMRLDRLVAKHAQVSRREARLLIGAGKVLLGRKVVRILTRSVRAGTRVTIHAGEQELATPAPRVEILHVDADIVVVNKPAKLLSEPDKGGGPSVETIVPGCLADAGERSTKVWLVHRLDAGTSGVMVLARKSSAARHVGDAFRKASVQKTYLALCSGTLERAQWVDLPIGRERGVRHAVRADGKPSSTRVEPMVTNDSASLVRALPRTGRTHQIRVHLAHLGHPLLGDRLYDGPGYTPDEQRTPIGRPMLHARALELPAWGAYPPREFCVAPPDDFLGLCVRLGLPLAPESSLE